MSKTNDMVIYTVDGCPKCEILKKRLLEANIPFCENNSEDDMKALGIDELPMLLCNNKLMTFAEAVKMIKQREKM